MSETNPTPARYWKRKDDSIGVSFGNPAEGYHEQFDFDGSEELAEFVIRAVNCHSLLLEALRGMLPEANKGDIHCRPDFVTCEVARDAIAEAEGRP